MADRTGAARQRRYISKLKGRRTELEEFKQRIAELEAEAAELKAAYAPLSDLGARFKAKPGAVIVWLNGAGSNKP